MIVIRAGAVRGAERPGAEKHIVVEGGRVAELLDRAPARVDGAETIDAGECVVAPGLIDLHCHGGMGFELGSGDEDSIAQVARYYASHGVTGFLAGLGSDRERTLKSIAATVRYANGPRRASGAAVLGIHLEGPFIDPSHGGAFTPWSIAAPDLALFREYLEAGEGFVKLVTLAPELPGVGPIIEEAVARGVVVSAGHSGATFAQMEAAVAAGVRNATHTFNAMRPFNHREPGIMGAALVDDRLMAEVIADGIHVHPASLKLLARAKGAERVCLVTDSVGAAGLPDGRYSFEGQEVFVADGSVRLADGTLAGSSLTMDQAVANMVAFGAANLEDALAMGSRNPARAIGLNSKGRIEKGVDADLVALDRDMSVAWTMIGGELVYRRG
jgi:N-acetylglucosamine-6-phosphate deacetylase